ncbi:hypothetical protein B0A55_00012 [Friedmanniomyces simplex]|uniref:Enoyl reductase (ER) domain-containing protein n=1 Tax=Friedmanniomyces simplex TaxID=329884 RepID=A0A4U0Y6B3_9PEZI|nr:hypothetical protein B0A55_00012 [Friedmanniomyces simplex]
MRALRYHGNRDVRVDEIAEPALRPGWVKIKNEYCGICGSDLHEYLVGPKNAPAKPHVLTGEQLPTILGHEFAGTIEALGEGLEDSPLKPGQKCAVFPVLGDRSCYWCRRDISGMCPKWGFLGYSGYGGGMAEYICVDARDVHLVPESMSLDVAALVEPLAVAWHGVKLGFPSPEAGDSALVLGAGPIGIAVILCLRAHGISTIIVSEISELRSQQARDAGATHVLNPLTTDVVEESKRLTDGLGCHVALECAGVQASFDTALYGVRGQGKIINIGVFEKDITFNPNIVNRRSLTYIGSNVYTRVEFQEVIDAVANGRIEHPERMITGRVALSEGVEKGFEALVKEREKHVKILIKASS